MNGKEYIKYYESLSKDNKPRLLLECCCGPCSSASLWFLEKYFNITTIYYNPNIYPESEFIKRKETFIDLLNKLPFKVDYIETKPYNHQEFLINSKGLEEEKEGGARCNKCFELRLDETAKIAKELSFDYFATTLSISPHKNAELINTIGLELEKKYGIKYLITDLKKNDGYLNSIKLSKEYDLYRQNYCGCEYSLRGNYDE